jgi:hypothetical protein
MEEILRSIQERLENEQDPSQFLDILISKLKEIRDGYGVRLIDRYANSVLGKIPMKGINVQALLLKKSTNPKEEIFRNNLFPVEYAFLWDAIKSKLKLLCKEDLKAQEDLIAFYANLKSKGLEEAVQELTHGDLLEIFKEYLSLRDSILTGAITEDLI